MLQAVFYAEYYNINSTGVSVTGAVLVAEIISCAKRTLGKVLYGLAKCEFLSCLLMEFAGPRIHFVYLSLKSVPVSSCSISIVKT